MRDARGTIFLSHSSKDKNFVEQVYKQLDSAVTFYDIKTIEPGESSVKAMESGVATTSTFVLFHSPDSDTQWVRFETELARIAKIKFPDLSVLAVPIKGTTHASLPDWMKSFMTTTEAYTVSDVARTILRLQSALLDKKLVIGREELLRRIALDIRKALPVRGTPIQHVMLSGLPGMGRSTLAADIISNAMPATRIGGPVFDLPDMAEGVDVYLRLKQDLDGEMSKEEVAHQIKSFNSLSEGDQGAFILKQLTHWAEINQVVILKSRWGFRDRFRTIKPWLKQVFSGSPSYPALRVIYISERSLPDEEVGLFHGILQHKVEALSKEDIEYLLSKLIDARLFEPNLCDAVAGLVLGHPATAHHVAYLVNNGRSFDTIRANPEPIYAFQNRMLDAIFSSGFLSDFQRRLLMLLGWFPRLPFKIIAKVITPADEPSLSKEIWELLDYSLLQVGDKGLYFLPDVVATRVKRDSNSVDQYVFKSVAENIQNNVREGSLDTNMIEALLISIVETTEGIPDEFKDIITTSALLSIVREQFEIARISDGGSKQKFEKIYQLSKFSMLLKGSDDAIEQILFTGGDCAIRAGIYPTDIIAFLERSGLPSVYYLRGSYSFYVKRDYPEAAKNLKIALQLKHFKLRNARLLAKCYVRSRKFAECLEVLDCIREDKLRRETGLLILKIRALRGMRRYEQADELEKKLDHTSDDFGEIALYNAGRFLREMNLPAASSHLETAKNAPRVNRLSVLLLECAIATERGDFSLLPAAVESATSAGREFDAWQLRARRAAVEQNWREALALLDRITQKDAVDIQLERRVLELKKMDPAISRDPAELAAITARDEELLRQSLASPQGYRDA